VQEIKVVLTMDCEPTTATSHPAATGPANWSAGEDAVLGYVEAAARYGLPVTFLVHPEAAVAQAAMFRDLERNGASLGLHMHPWNMPFGVTKDGNISPTTVGFPLLNNTNC
jgi:hypothetical protein